MSHDKIKIDAIDRQHMINRKKIIVTAKKNDQKWSSFEQSLGRASKVKGFTELYNEELRRLKIAKQVRELRLEQKFTQKNISEKTGMPQSVIARLESGEHSISLDTLSRIAYALGKEVALVSK